MRYLFTCIYLVFFSAFIVQAQEFITESQKDSLQRMFAKAKVLMDQKYDLELKRDVVVSMRLSYIDNGNSITNMELKGKVDTFRWVNNWDVGIKTAITEDSFWPNMLMLDDYKYVEKDYLKNGGLILFNISFTWADNAKEFRKYKITIDYSVQSEQEEWRDKVDEIIGTHLKNLTIPPLDRNNFKEINTFLGDILRKVNNVLNPVKIKYNDIYYSEGDTIVYPRNKAATMPIEIYSSTNQLNIANITWPENIKLNAEKSMIDISGSDTTGENLTFTYNNSRKTFYLKALEDSRLIITHADKNMYIGNNRLSVQYYVEENAGFQKGKLEIIHKKTSKIIYNDANIRTSGEKILMQDITDMQAGWSGMNSKTMSLSDTGTYILRLIMADNAGWENPVKKEKTFRVLPPLLELELKSPEFYECFEFEKQKELNEISIKYSDLPVFGATGTKVCVKKKDNKCIQEYFDKLKIQYTIKNLPGSNIINPKLYVLLNGQDSLPAEMAFKSFANLVSGDAHFLEWQGEDNTEAQRVKFSQSPFTVILTGTVKEGETEKQLFIKKQAYVDEISDQWAVYKYTDPSLFAYYRFHRKKWENSLFLAGVNENPLQYLEENIVDGPNYFLGYEMNEPINIRFLLALKILENDMGYYADEELFSRIFHTVITGLRISASKSSVSNHSLGFGLDIDAKKNPQIISSDIYHLIDVFSGINLKGKHFFYDKETMAEAHDKFINFFNIPPYNWDYWDPDTKTDENAKRIMSTYPENLLFIDQYQKNSSWFSFLSLTNSSLINEVKNFIIEYNKNITVSTYSSKSNWINLQDKFEVFKNVIKSYNTVYRLEEKHSSEYQQYNNYMERLGKELTKLEALVKTELPINLSETNESTDNIMEISLDYISKQYSLMELITILKKYDEKVGDYKNLANTFSSLNSQSDWGGKGIFWWGFWSIPLEFVDYMTNYNFEITCLNNEDNGTYQFIYWGGFFASEHDWMHFEVNSYDRDIKDENYFRNGQKLLNKIQIEKVIEEINKLSKDEKYEINKENGRVSIVHKK